MKKRFLDFILFIIVLIVILVCFILSNNSNPKTEDKKNNNDVNVAEEKKLEEKNYIKYDGQFELPVEGASGYAPISMPLKFDTSADSGDVITLSPGDGFTILEEVGEWWKVKFNNYTGYIESNYCFINLPDIIPSIIYNITNSSSSIMKSSLKDIPNVTNKKLYDVYFYNNRFNEEQYVAPVLYGMAKKIMLAQQKAKENNSTLIIYESFRPAETQKRVANELRAFANVDVEVNKGINTEPWSIVWYIHTGLSNHQKGLAIDVSLGEILKIEEKTTVDYIYEDITEYREYTMPSPMHELSVISTKFTIPVSTYSKTAWLNVPFAETMNDSAIKLHEICTSVGLSPIASEWWHFNDLDCVNDKNGNGQFFLSGVYSS